MTNSFYIFTSLFIILLLIVVGVYFNTLAQYFYGGQENANPKGELLKVLIQSLGGLVLLFGAYHSLQIANATNENNRLVERANTAERFVKAVNMLGDESSNTCLSGVYALHSIAKDNAEYREQVFNVLVEFINTETRGLPSWADIAKSERLSTKPSIEIQTVVKLLFSKQNSIYKSFKATFNGAKLYGSEFNNYNFSNCRFNNVELQNSSFQDSWFIKCNIYNTDFTLSDFEKSDFTESTIMDSTVLSCCRLSHTLMLGCFIQDTDFTCSKILNSFFEGTIVNGCCFDGVEICTINSKGTFNGASFSKTSSLGLMCSGDGIIARGANFEAGFSSMDFNTNIRSIINKEATINLDSNLKNFPEEKLKHLENLIDIESPIKFYCHTVYSIKKGQWKTTGWQFRDLGIFTKNDSKIIFANYDDSISKIQEDKN